MGVLFYLKFFILHYYTPVQLIHFRSLPKYKHEQQKH